jgi:hypothetical protein
VTGPVDGSLLVDGSVVRGKLARESVLPENHGRGNSVRSFAVNCSTGDVGTFFYTVPAGKTFIVTDVVVPQSGYTYLRVPNASGTFINRAFLYAPSNGSGFFPFQAGIRFDAGESLYCYGNHLITFSGYEF